MKITRQHFICSPFLAVNYGYLPTLIDCIIHTWHEINFKSALNGFKWLLMDFLDTTISELPGWIAYIVIHLLIILFYPVIFSLFILLKYVLYATPWGVKKQRKEYQTYSKHQIRCYKARLKWGQL